jgi:hypothetical protein
MLFLEIMRLLKANITTLVFHNIQHNGWISIITDASLVCSVDGKIGRIPRAITGNLLFSS